MEVGFGTTEFILFWTWIWSDIHMGNVLFRLPGLEPSSPQRAIEEFGIPQRGKVSRKDGAPLEKGLPEYLVEPVEYEAKDSKFLDEVQLVDFGECTYSCNWLALLLD